MRLACAAVRRSLRWPRRIDPALAAVVGVGVLVRLVWCLVAVRPHVGQHDPAVYVRLATDLAEGRGYHTASGAPTAYYPVGYPALLAVAWWLVIHTPLPDDVWWTAAGLNIVAGAVTVACVGVVGRRVIGRRAGLLAAGVVALAPNLVFNSAPALTESSFVALSAAALVVLGVGAIRQRPPARAVGAGVLFGLAGLVRPVGLVLVLAVVAAALLGRVVGRRSEPPPWAAPRALRWMVLGVVVVTVPWVARNDARIGRPTLATSTGDNLCIGNNPGANGAFQLPDVCFADVPDLVGGTDEARRDRILSSRATHWAVDHLGEQPRLVWQRSFWTMRSDHDGLRAVQSYEADPWLTTYHRGLERLLAAGADLWWWLLLAGAIVGAWRGRWFVRSDRLLVLAGTLGLLMAVWPFFGDTRFHLPMVPLLALPAADALDRLLGRFGDAAPGGVQRHEEHGEQGGPVHHSEDQGPAEAGRGVGHELVQRDVGAGAERQHRAGAADEHGDEV